MVKDFGEIFSGAADMIGRAFSGDFWSRTVLSDTEKAGVEQRAYDMAAGIMSAMQGLAGDMLAAGKEAIASLWAGMEAKLADLLEWVKGIPARIAEAMPKIDLWPSDRPDAPLMRDPDPEAGVQQRMGMGTPHVEKPDGEHAGGGSIFPGRSYLVGERHAEMLFPSRAAYVASHQQTRALMDMARRSRVAPAARSVAASASIPRATGPTGPASINFGDIVIQGGANASADDIGRALGRHANAALRSHYSDNF